MSGLNCLKKTKTELIQEFKQFYYQKAAPLLPDYEAKRGKEKYNLYLFNAIVLGFIILALFHFSQIMVCIGGALIFISFFALILLNPQNKAFVINSDYEMVIKEKLMPEFLSLFGNFSWSKYVVKDIRGIFKKFKTLKIFPITHLFAFDDLILGEYGGINLKLYEIRTGFRAINLPIVLMFVIILCIVAPIYFTILFSINSFIMNLVSIFNKNLGDALFLIFQALIFVFPPILAIIYAIRTAAIRCLMAEFEIPKNFSGNTCIYEKAATAKKLIFKSKNGMEPVHLEDIKFSELYNVFSTDQIEARYLLTTAFIERFLNIKTAFKADYIRAEFLNNKLILVIGVSKDLFAMGNVSKKTTGKTFVELFEELYSVLELIDTLKLNQKTGL